MALDLFAGIPVTDYAAARPWYERFFGGQPSFLPNDTEAVWQVAEQSASAARRAETLCAAAYGRSSRMSRLRKTGGPSARSRYRSAAAFVSGSPEFSMADS